ncbi:TP53-binding protein 1 isoform 2-T4 [Menidia menidia]
MDPGGSELDSSLPQSENPCLIVEDSQPDSVALEDDPESSYRALLARRLSSLQPTARSPVLELISSPLGSLCSQTDSQSESPSRPPPEESQVLNVCPPPSRAEDLEMEPGADSTTNCVQSEGGSSQFGFLELSQSQDLRAEDAAPPLRKPAEQTPSGRAGGRSEVSSSSSSESQGPVGRKLTVQALLHSQNQDRDLDPDQDQDKDQDQQDCEILSSQEDLFDAERTGSAVDSTVSEPEQQGPPTPTPTPAATLRLLHLSGQKTLVQESLSQSSVDFVAPTPEGFPPTPVIVPSSPTDLEKDQGADEPMDTSLPPDSEKDEPMETEAAFSRPHPPAGPHPASSTPVSQKPPGVELDRTPSVPSQPEFSHDVFVPTQSPEVPPQPGAKPASPPPQLSANSQGRRTEEEEPEEDSQATQIEEPEEEEEEEKKKEEEPKASEDKHSLEATRSRAASGSQPAPAGTPSDGLVQETPSSSTTSSITSSSTSATTSFSTACTLPSQSGVSQPSAGVKLPLEMPASQSNHEADREEEEEEEEEEKEEEEEEEVVMEAENTGGEASGLALVLSQSQMLSPEPMEEDALTDGQRNSQLLEEDGGPRRNAGGGGGAQPGEGGGGGGLQPGEGGGGAESPKLAGGGGPQLAGGVGGSPQLAGGGEGERGGGGGAPASTNGLGSQSRDEEEQAAGAEPEGLGDRSLGDSSGDISFHFTLPKEGELIGPASGATPPLLNQLKQTLRHSTPIEVAFSEKPDAAGGLPADVLMTTSGITPGDGEDAGGGADGDAGGGADGKLSLRMRLVTPVEEGSSERFSLQKPNLAEEDASVVKVTASSVTVTSPSVFTRVRQVLRQPEAEEDDQPDNSRALLRGELFGSPQRSSPASPGGSQSEAPQREKPEDGPGGGRGPPAAPEPPPPKGPGARQKGASPPSSQARQRGPPQQSSFQASGLRSPPGREPESPAFRRAAAVSHRRHVRTIQEVRTTVTRIITDVYYEDGKEVERKVTEESEEPVLDCQVLDSDVSPSRTGCSSVTSGDLADVSSPSSKASSLQHSSGGPSRPGFAVPPSRGARNDSPRRGGGHPQRGHRGHRSGSEVSTFVPLSPRGRARRGRPPSRSPPTRGAGVRSPQRVGAPGPPPPPPSSSEDEPFARTPGPRPPAGRHSDSPEAGSSFVGLRVVAKWASNGYFYSGRIVGDDGGEGRGVEGEGRFRLRFDDGYECEVAARDVLLCDPIPLEAEVTALLEDQYFSTGVVKGHKIEGQDLFYSVEKEGQRRWYSRAAVILSLEQGNRLREQHSLGPYQPSTPLAKASDISLDNLVDGKRRRRGPPPGGADTPNRSPRTPSGKRKLTAGEESRTPSKRGRRGGGVRAAQRPAPCTSSGSGSELPPSQSQVASTHGPMPPNASLFMGFAFMLTAASARDRESNRTLTEEEEGEGEEGYVQTGPYNKAYTESQLEAGGGFILPHFNEEQCKAAYQSLLIADQHCRTRKYLLCLAAGVPPVSHLWVRDCCLHNKLLNYRSYLLPAGHGPHTHMVEWHPRCRPFRGLRVLLVVQVLEELWFPAAAAGRSLLRAAAPPPGGGVGRPGPGPLTWVVADGPAPPAGRHRPAGLPRVAGPQRHLWGAPGGPEPARTGPVLLLLAPRDPQGPVLLLLAPRDPQGPTGTSPPPPSPQGPTGTSPPPPSPQGPTGTSPPPPSPQGPTGTQRNSSTSGSRRTRPPPQDPEGLLLGAQKDSGLVILVRAQ